MASKLFKRHNAEDVRIEVGIDDETRGLHIKEILPDIIENGKPYTYEVFLTREQLDFILASIQELDLSRVITEAECD